ncbi:hypothetical protein GUITHDRAFT_42966, partial [Guillardia theta CCMP2712]
CPPACSAHGVCEWGYCVCDVGFLGVTCEQQQCPNSRCVYDYRNHVNDCLLCSGNGVCNANATCICDVGWKGEDCR